MSRSIDAGADAVEVDVWMTTDGVVVAQHDRQMAAGVGLAGNIDELTWTDLQTADLRGAWQGEPIDQPVRVASLEDILATFDDITVAIEIKQVQPSIADELCETLQRNGAIGRVYLSSNDDAALYEAQGACPPDTVITTTYADVAVMRAARESGDPYCAAAPIGQPPFSDRLLDPAQIQWSHDHGSALFTWTVDDPDTLRALALAGIDGVYTRRPDVARRVFDDVESVRLP
jgi:glycerophosphoryl diester phosphodiesterase